MPHRNPILVVLLLVLAPIALAQQTRRPVATYSIVARDPATGQLGVAVQSHWFGVGQVVPWAEAGVGAVATQSMVDPTYGELGLRLMASGRSAEAALRALVAGDEAEALRQVAMIDAQGRVAAHTGARCIAEAGQLVDAEAQFSVQANMMERDTVWRAMATAYRTAEGDLADRLLAALTAAQGEGGDIRGKQAAALIVVRAEPTGKRWLDRIVDLRVDDHPEPLVELGRLLQVQRAYNHMNAGDLAIEAGDLVAANAEYAAAERYAPQIVEIRFWRAITLASTGGVDEALPLLEDVYRREPIWRELVPRLVPAGILPDDPELLRRLTAPAPGQKATNRR